MDTKTMIKSSRASTLKPVFLLKDHLLDDMSSCSSNGFKSFPRRQCCNAAVPTFLLREIDLKKKNQKQNANKKTPPKPSSSSSLSEAIKSVFTAMKRFPFSAEKRKFKNTFLSRNFSKKNILSKSSFFWKRTKTSRKQIERWILYDNLLVEEPEPPSDLSNSSMTTSDESKSKNWSSGSEFTVSSGDSNSSSEVNLTLPNNVIEETKKGVSDEESSVKNGVVSMDSMACSSEGSVASNSHEQKQWSNGEKEQFSPVSVLDCPFKDEGENDDEVSSRFKHRLSRMEGTKKQLMKKIQKFESFTQLEPVNLSKRFSSLQESVDEPTGSPTPHYSPTSTDEKFISDIEEEQIEEEEEEEEVEQKALELFHRTMDMLPSYNSLEQNSNKLLLDFFTEKITDGLNSGKQRVQPSLDEELVEEARDWINGQKTRGLFLDWNVQVNRQVYVKDMEKNGEWKNSDDQEHKEVALELEIEVFGAILDELLLELSA